MNAKRIKQGMLAGMAAGVVFGMMMDSFTHEEYMATAAGLRKPEKELIDGDFMYTVIPPGGIPEIKDPVFVDASEAAPWMNDDEMIIGVLGPDGEARAYSTWHLDHHEIVNDYAGETPIAVTW